MSQREPTGPAPTTDDLRSVLAGTLHRSVGGDGAIAALGRRASDYRTSHALDELTVTLADGRQVEMLFKNLGRGFLHPDAREVKPGFLEAPSREIEVYRSLLTDVGLGTARCYATVIDDRQARYWLFLEHVSGVELYQVGELAVWQEVARWLAAFHARFARERGWHDRPGASQLVPYDRTLYETWLARARAFGTRRKGSDVGDVLARLDQRWDELAEHVFDLPTTLIHGELYASNVLVDRSRNPTRVCPVDWEMAGVGPGVLDLAALTAGGWTETERAAIAMAYHDAAGGEAAMPRQRFLMTLGWCRALLTVQWLGWARGWSPPAEHQRDWAADLDRLLTEL